MCLDICICVCTFGSVFVFVLHESNIHIIDADVLHVNGKVGHHGEGGAVEEEQGELEREQVHVGPGRRRIWAAGVEGVGVEAEVDLGQVQDQDIILEEVL